MKKAIEDENNLSATDTKPTPTTSSKASKSTASKSSKSAASNASSSKKKKNAKHRRRNSKSAVVQAQQQKPQAASAAADSTKKKSSKDADAPKSTCLGIGFFIQFFICVGILVGWMLSYFYMDTSLQYAYLILMIVQFELLTVLILATYFKALACAVIVNHVVFFFLELGYAIYVTVQDISEDCYDNGCTCLHGTLLHRIIFVGICVIIGGIHAMVSCCISVGVCLSKVEKEEANVEAQKSTKTAAVSAEPKALPRKNHWIDEAPSRSSSVSAKSRKRRSAAKKVSLSVSSWNTLPSKSSDAAATPSFPPPTPSSVSSYPTDSSQKVTSSVTSSDYPYCPPQPGSTATSVCPYSAALVAQSKQVGRAPQAFYPPPCPTPNPFLFYGYGQPQQHQPPPAVNASEDVTVNVTYPSVTSLGGTKEFASVTVRIPSAYPHQQQGYPQQQQQQLPAALQPQVSVQRHHRRGSMAYYPYPDPNYRPHKAQSVKTAKGFGNGGSDFSSFNISQTSEANSMVLPSSFASQDDRSNAGQRIFTANTPTSKHY